MKRPALLLLLTAGVAGFTYSVAACSSHDSDGASGAGVDANGIAPGNDGSSSTGGNDATLADGAGDDGGVSVDAGPPPCPTAPPVDFSDADVAARCGRLLYVAGGNRSLRLSSDDLLSWSNEHVDQSNCLAADDASLNCGQTGLTDGAVYDCSHKDPTTCGTLLDGLQCAGPDPADPSVTVCGGFDDGAFGVTFGLGLVVACSDFGIFTSADGAKTWTKASTPAPQQWGQGGHVCSAAFGNGKFLVLGDDQTFVSTDGYTWTKNDFTVDGGGTGYWGFHNVAYGNGHFVAVGTQRITQAGKFVDVPFVKATDDGINWYGVLTNTDIANVVFDGKQFFAVGLAGKRATSPDGMTWTTVASDDPTCTDPSKWTGAPEKCLGNLGLVAYGDGQYMVCGSYCALSTDDGATWARTKAWTYLPLFYANSRFYYTQARVDGLAWTVDGGAWSVDPDASTTDAAVNLGMAHVASGWVLK